MPVALQSRQSHAHLSWFLFVHTFLSFRRINKRGRGELAVDAGTEPWRLRISRRLATRQEPFLRSPYGSFPLVHCDFRLPKNARSGSVSAS